MLHCFIYSLIHSFIYLLPYQIYLIRLPHSLALLLLYPLIPCLLNESIQGNQPTTQTLPRPYPTQPNPTLPNPKASYPHGPYLSLNPRLTA